MARDQRRLAAVVSADVAGYSRLMGRDDSDTLARLGAHRRDLIDPKIAEFGGRIVKTTGDGLLLEFPSVVNAVRCAVDVQRGMLRRNAGLSADQRMEFRVGVDVGDIIIEGDDIYGDGVNVAARLQELAEPGGICVSGRVHEDVYGKLNATFEDAGTQQLKNIARPVRVHRMSLTEKHNPQCLRVSVVPSFAARWLLPRIGRFVAAHPDIDLDVRATPALADFARNDADVAIRIGGGNWAGATADLLFDEFYTPVCSPHLKGARLLSAPADLADYTLLSSTQRALEAVVRSCGARLARTHSRPRIQRRCAHGTGGSRWTGCGAGANFAAWQRHPQRSARSAVLSSSQRHSAPIWSIRHTSRAPRS